MFVKKSFGLIIIFFILLSSGLLKAKVVTLLKVFEIRLEFEVLLYDWLTVLTLLYSALQS